MCDLDMFLEKSKKYLNSDIDEKQIEKIREIRKLDLERMITHKKILLEREMNLNPKLFEDYSTEYIHVFEEIRTLFKKILNQVIQPKHRIKLINMFNKLTKSNMLLHHDFNREYFYNFYKDTIKFSNFFDVDLSTESIKQEYFIMMKKSINKLKFLNNHLKHHIL